MQIQQTERSFRYSGLVLPDPDSSLGIEAVRQVYCLIVSGDYHGSGERSRIGRRKTGLHVQDGGGDEIMSVTRSLLARATRRRRLNWTKSVPELGGEAVP